MFKWTEIYSRRQCFVRVNMILWRRPVKEAEKLGSIFPQTIILLSQGESSFIWTSAMADTQQQLTAVLTFTLGRMITGRYFD